VEHFLLFLTGLPMPVPSAAAKHSGIYKIINANQACLYSLDFKNEKSRPSGTAPFCSSLNG
jgi:hypothetical protein